MAPSKKNYATFCLVFVLILLLVVGMGAVSLMSNTLISPFYPIAFAFLAAVAIGPWANSWWSRLSRRKSIAINWACHLVGATVLFTGIFYIGNYGFADDATLHTETAVVGRKFYTVQHRTKRIARNRYAQGEPYNVYHMEVSFSTGQTKDLRIPRKLYNSISAGDTLALPVEMGLFGAPVVVSSILYRQ